MIKITPFNKIELDDKQKAEVGTIMQNIILKCWQDDAFQSLLVNEPIKVFKEEGVDFEGYKSVKVQIGAALVNDSGDEHFVFNIPEKPDEEMLEEIELSEDELEKAAGGDGVLLSIAYIGSVAASISLYDYVFGNHRFAILQSG